jgi:hypothetical protein
MAWLEHEGCAGRIMGMVGVTTMVMMMMMVMVVVMNTSRACDSNDSNDRINISKCKYSRRSSHSKRTTQQRQHCNKTNQNSIVFSRAAAHIQNLDANAHKTDNIRLVQQQRNIL